MSENRFMRLTTGRLFDPWACEFDKRDLTPPRLTLMDIAHPLAQVPRFGGHAKELRSVGAHSLDVAELLRLRNQPSTTQLCGLLHDAHEAFLGDALSPWAWRLGPDWTRACERLQFFIEAQLGVITFTEQERLEVARADEDMLHIEAAHLLLNGLDGSTPSDVVDMRGPEVALALRLRSPLRAFEVVDEFVERFKVLRTFAQYDRDSDGG